jgi:hypothetical protein
MTIAILILLSYGYTIGLVLLFGSKRKSSDLELPG